MIVNIITLLLLLNYKIVAVTSATVRATTEAANKLEITSASTTETLDRLTQSSKMTTEGPTNTDVYEMPTEDLRLNDIERKIIKIFALDLFTTSARKASDELSSVEVVASEMGENWSLGRRTDFRTRRNCYCIKHNRCATTDSCLYEMEKEEENKNKNKK